MSSDQELLRAVALEVALGCGVLEAALLAGGFEGAPMARDLARAGSDALMLAGSDALLGRLRILRMEGDGSQGGCG